MKTLLFLLIFLSSFELLASQDCKGLMRSFVREDSKTENKMIDLYAQCMSPDKNKFKELSTKRFSSINDAMTYATTVIGFTNNNWDKPKDMEWFEKLGFNLAFTAVAGKFFNVLVHDDGNRFNYLIKSYFYNRGMTVVFLGGNSLLFNNNQADLAHIEKLKKSPTFSEDMKALAAYANDKSLFERYKNELITYLSQQKIINTGVGVHDGIDFDHLTPQDLDNPDIQKVVIAAIFAQEYSARKGALAVTGSNTGDFYLYDSVYSVAKIPKDIMVNKVIDRALCLNFNNPARGITQAVGITALNQILFADYYGITYKVLKKELINQ